MTVLQAYPRLAAERAYLPPTLLGAQIRRGRFSHHRDYSFHVARRQEEKRRVRQRVGLDASAHKVSKQLYQR